MQPYSEVQGEFKMHLDHVSATFASLWIGFIKNSPVINWLVKILLFTGLISAKPVFETCTNEYGGTDPAFDIKFLYL